MVCRSKATDEVVLERLDGSLSRVYSVIVWLYELPFAFFLLQKYLEWLGRLIICDIQEWLVPLGHKRLVDLLERLDDRIIRHVWDRFGKNVVIVVIVRDEVVLIGIHGSGWQCPRGICVQCALLFVC